jgi:hypothetical protein
MACLELGFLGRISFCTTSIGTGIAWDGADYRRREARHHFAVHVAGLKTDVGVPNNGGEVWFFSFLSLYNSRWTYSMFGAGSTQAGEVDYVQCGVFLRNKATSFPIQ